MKIKKFFLDIAFSVYEPIITRTEKIRATMLWRKGVKQCVQMYKEIGSPRVYLLWDGHYNVWSPMTYEPNKAMKPSLRMLRRMGKARGIAKIKNVEDMKAYSFYYTPSKWGALGCAEDNRLRTEKLSLWLAYYMTKVSEPMRKCREYRQTASDSRH